MQLNKNELKYQSSETHIHVPSYDCPYPIPNDLNVRYFTIKNIFK